MGTDKQQRESEGPLLTDKTWNHVRHNGQLVRDEVAADLPPKQCSAVWQQFKQMPMAECACFLLSVLEPEAPAGLYRRNARRLAGVGLFDAIPSLAERDKAEEIDAELCGRHSQRLDSCRWLRPVLPGGLAGWPRIPRLTDPPGATRCAAERQGNTPSSATESRAGTLGISTKGLGD
jgi:hypothetical protein